MAEPTERIHGTHNMNRRTLIERALAWTILTLLVLGCLAVVRPFISSLLWAVVLCFSVWPLYQRLLAWLGQRRTLAAALICTIMVLLLVLPLLLVGLSMADNVKDLTAATRRWVEAGPPEPPAWLAKVPLVGEKGVEYWQSLAADTAKVWTDAKRLIEPLSSGLLKLGLMAGGGLMELGMSVIIAFFLFRDGAWLAERLSAAAERLGGERGKHLLQVAGNTVRGVVYGILGTAIVQGILAGIGFLIAGVPGAAVLALLTFLVSVLPILGASAVWLPAALWLFYQGSTGWGIFILVWGVGINALEHVLKPILISKGCDLPFLLILFGVLGGAVAFGFIGIFLGPTLLAVGFALVKEWIAATPVTPHEPQPSPPVKG
jgi:predicted PurR-regulated permease PerM